MSQSVEILDLQTPRKYQNAGHQRHGEPVKITGYQREGRHGPIKTYDVQFEDGHRQVASADQVQPA